MGQPKFPRKKFETPNHPWQGERIKEEHELRRKFGLKNKREIWKAQSRLRSIRGQARGLISRTRNPDDVQAQAESKLLLKRLYRQGFIGEEATLNEVLGLDIERILNRRLQSQVYLKGLARTPKQARQFVSHGLITIGERRVDVPSYTVRRDEEEMITFTSGVAVASPEHPVRPRAPGQELVAPVAEVVEDTPAPAAEPEAAPEAAPEPVAEPEAAPEPEATPEAEAPAEEPKAEADVPAEEATAEAEGSEPVEAEAAPTEEAEE